jgi:hypothetical protein
VLKFDVKPSTQARVVAGLRPSLTFDDKPTWLEMVMHDPAKRAALMRDPEARAALSPVKYRNRQDVLRTRALLRAALARQMKDQAPQTAAPGPVNRPREARPRGNRTRSGSSRDGPSRLDDDPSSPGSVARSGGRRGVVPRRARP